MTVGGERRPVDVLPRGDASAMTGDQMLLVSVPKDTPDVLLTATSGPVVQSLSLTTGKRTTDTAATYYRSGTLTDLNKSLPNTPGNQGRDFTSTYSLALQKAVLAPWDPARGWAPQGKAWVRVQLSLDPQVRVHPVPDRLDRPVPDRHRRRPASPRRSRQARLQHPHPRGPRRHQGRTAHGHRPLEVRRQGLRPQRHPQVRHCHLPTPDRHRHLPLTTQMTRSVEMPIGRRVRSLVLRSAVRRPGGGPDGPHVPSNQASQPTG